MADISAPVAGGVFGPNAAATGSIYDAYQRFSQYGNTPSGYGQQIRMPWDTPDSDPLGERSRKLAMMKVKPYSEDIVDGVYLRDGSWASRDELLSTDHGRKLLRTEEQIRHGHKLGFLDSLSEWSWKDLVPFIGMAARIGGDISYGQTVAGAFQKLENGESLTRDEAILSTLYRNENDLAADGAWGYTFGSIVRQAPSFFMEMGLLNKAGSAVRTAAVRGLVTDASDATAKTASWAAVSKAGKVGVDESVEAAFRAAAKSEVDAMRYKSMEDAMVALAKDKNFSAKLAESTLESSKGIIQTTASVSNPSEWAPGLLDKVAKIRNESAVRSLMSRWSSDHVLARSWAGLTKAVKDSAVSGVIDMGSWGTESATVLTSGFSRAGKAALDAVVEGTVGSFTRGATQFFPREVVTEVINASVGSIGQSRLALMDAAVQNNDRDLMDNSWWMGMCLDLLEYVSENTGRAFNSAGRAIGLAVAPKLMQPVTRTAGISQVMSASVARNTSGQVTGVTVNGLIEKASQARAGGVVRQYLERVFGARSMKENVASDRFNAAVAYLESKGIREPNQAALESTLRDGVIRPGLSPDVAAVVGGDVRKFMSDSLSYARKKGLDELKYRGFALYYIADFLTRHNIDALAAGDMFVKMGYDGILSEMLEERYSDFTSALFGLDAESKHSFTDNLGRAIGALLPSWDQLTAEAMAFALPMVARAGIMRGIASLSRPNQYSELLDISAKFNDATRFNNIMSRRSGEYLDDLARQMDRLTALRDKEHGAYRTMHDSASSPVARIDRKSLPAVPDTEAAAAAHLAQAKRLNKALRRLTDIRKNFLASLSPEAASNPDYVVAASYISDEELMLPDEQYDLRSRPSVQQARQAQGAYKSVIDGAAQIGQTLYMFRRRNRATEKDGNLFRRIAHNVVETSMRLAGTVATGDFGFMTANPARWNSVDRGLPPDVADVLERQYAAIYESELRADQAARVETSGVDGAVMSQADCDAAHARALEKFSPVASQLMTELLSRHQLRMFAHEEIEDIATYEAARERGFAYSFSDRQFVGVDGTRITFDEFSSKEENKSRIQQLKEEISADALDVITSGMGVTRMLDSSEDRITRTRDVITIPKNLPTTRQAMLARAIRSIPALRNATIAVEADPDRSIDDQLVGMATRAEWLSHITETILPAGVVTSRADYDVAVARMNDVDPAIIEQVARDLNISDDGTRESVLARNAEIARIAILTSATTNDPDTVMFSRNADSEEMGDRIGMSYALFSPARRTADNSWTILVRPHGERADVQLSAPTVEELASMLSDPKFGYLQTSPKVVFTPARIIQSDDPLSMITVLNLGRQYVDLMKERTEDQLQLDPALRKNDDGTDMYPTDELCDNQRTLEKDLSDLWDSVRHQHDAALFLQPGETSDDAAAMERAAYLMDSAEKCWIRRNGTRASDGAAQGYIAVAKDLLRRANVTVPYEGNTNSFGLGSSALRGKYVLDIRTIRSTGSTGNTYITINHGEAQDYESALLTAAIETAYAKNRALLGAYKTRIQSFMSEMNVLMKNLVQGYLSQESTVDLGNKIESYRQATVANETARDRFLSPSSFSEFVSAFCLFRDLVSDDLKTTVLGPNAAALSVLAPQVRKLVGYNGFCAVVDRMLGGSGFERELLSDEETYAGLSKYFSLFSPKGMSMRAAMESVIPGRSFAEFVRVATEQAASIRTKTSDSTPSLDPSPMTSPLDTSSEPVDVEDNGSEDVSPEEEFARSLPDDLDGHSPLDTFAVLQRLARDNNLTDEETARVAQNTSAVLNGGNTIPVFAGLPVDSDADVSDDGFRISSDDDEFDDHVVISNDYEDELSMGSAIDLQPNAVNPDGTRVVRDEEVHDGLLPSEVDALVGTLGQMSRIIYGDVPNRVTFRNFVNSIIPGLDRGEGLMKSIMDRFTGAVKSDEAGDLWAWTSDDDDEGATTSAYHGSAERAVDLLKQKALTRFLAIMNVVSPHTGRELQPFVEDLRSAIAEAPQLVYDITPEQREAFDYLNAILNPRMEDSVDSADLREAMFYDRIRMMSTTNPAGRAKIEQYIRALIGDGSTPPPCLRGAVLLSYMMGIKKANIRENFASLIGASSPSSPVRVNLTFGVDSTGKSYPIFLTAPSKYKTGTVSMSAVTSAFSRLAGMTSDEVSEVADWLEASFKDSVKRGAFDHVTPVLDADGSQKKDKDGRGRVARRWLYSADGNGTFNEYARILAPVFGADSPLVSMLCSRRLAIMLIGDYRNTLNKTYSDEDARSNAIKKTRYAQLEAKFTTSQRDRKTGLPYAALTILETVRAIASLKRTNQNVSKSEVSQKAVEMFRSGAPSQRNINWATTSIQGETEWSRLMKAYADSQPATIMRAEMDPERTNKPASSVAITMVGVEPALMQFMDRKDQYGFKSVIKEWMSVDTDSDSSRSLIAKARQRMSWPVGVWDSIVAKSISKTAKASEVLQGCATAYALETSPDTAKFGALSGRYVKNNMVYVPVFSGDHSSFILIQVPLAKEFAAKKMSYMDAARLVAKWVGLDLLGADPKRSSLTSMEAMSTSMRGIRTNPDGTPMLGDDGKPQTGHCYTSIIWNSDPRFCDSKAANEAMLGSGDIYGYGASRQRRASADPHSMTIKCHLASVAESPVYGPTLEFNKGLFIARDEKLMNGDFVAASPHRAVMDHAKSILGNDDKSTVVIADRDAVKLGVINSKTVGADKGDGKPTPLVQYVFGKINEYLNSGKTISGQLSGQELDDIVGDIKWVNPSDSGVHGDGVKLSGLLVKPVVREVRREGTTESYGGHKMFSLTFETDNLMAFSVANVSHEAKVEKANTPRNHVLDALAMSRVLRTWNGDTSYGSGSVKVLPGVKGLCDGMRDFVSAWGFLSAALSNHGDSITNQLSDDEGFLHMGEYGENLEGGDHAEEAKVRKFASWARKSNLGVPMNCVTAPLVSNISWIGDDGEPHSHSSSPMFNDTLRGPRTIAVSDRQFFRGHKRVGICNVNCVDPFFRHGLYIDHEKLLQRFSSVADSIRKNLAARNQPEPSQRDLTILVLENVIKHISEQDTREAQATSSEGDNWRFYLAECLRDHHDVQLSARYTERKVRDKDKNGNEFIRSERVYAYKSVSYLDLFTSVTSGSKYMQYKHMQFDRTAVYEGMHDSKGVERLYLGGTMMGLPRTPSYNGSMWCQTVRAGLPVTENFDESKPEQWVSGRDAMVAPDPYSLAILGCDHDGDKTSLYMLTDRGIRGSGVPFQNISELLDGVDEMIEKLSMTSGGLTMTPAVKAEVEAYLRRLSDKGIIEYRKEKVTLSTGEQTYVLKELRLTKAAQDRISNTFIQMLFDMNRSLPVRTTAEETFLDSAITDRGNVGLCGRPTKPRFVPSVKDDGATPGPGTLEDVMSTPGAVAEKIIDEADPDKLINNPDVATRAQDSAAEISVARGVVVAIASTLHFAYMSGLKVGPFAYLQNVPAEEWISFMYHLDGISNMTFDDIKEQICTRFGLRANMIETVISDILSESRVTGHLPCTDVEFAEAFKKYSVSANEKLGARKLMSRASDPSDFMFRRAFYSLITGKVSTGKSLPGVDPDSGFVDSNLIANALGLDDATRETLQSLTLGADTGITSSDSLVGCLQKAANQLLSDDKSGYHDPEYVRGLFISAVSAAVRSASQPNRAINGYVYRILRASNDPVADAKDMLRWFDGTSLISEAKEFADALNCAHVDPSSDSSGTVAARLDAAFNSENELQFVPGTPGEDGKIVMDDETVANLRMCRRLRAATALMYSGSCGRTIAAQGLAARQNFRYVREAFTSAYVSSATPSGMNTPEAMMVMAMNAVPLLKETDKMGLEANVETVRYSLAAFNTVRDIPGSPINKVNSYEFMERLAQAMAIVRHGGGPVKAAGKPSKNGNRRTAGKAEEVTADTRGSNTTLDARYAIESMVDVVARFVTNSTTHEKLPIFDYIKETADADTNTYDPNVYGPAARGLSRIMLSMGKTNGDQVSDIQDLYDRVVIGRELDDDGKLGSQTYIAASNGFIQKAYAGDGRLTFTLSSKNLKNMKKLALSASWGSDADATSAETGSYRDTVTAIDELIKVFDMLDRKYKTEIKIPPSVLLGQILPLYVSFTTRAASVPDPDSPSLFKIMRGQYAALSDEVARMKSDPLLRMVVDAVTPVNFRCSAVVVPEKSDGDDHFEIVDDDVVYGYPGSANTRVKRMIPRHIAEKIILDNERDLYNELVSKDFDAKEFSKKIKKLLNKGDASGSYEYATPVKPKYRDTIAIFDGTRAMLFKAAMQIARGQGFRNTPVFGSPVSARPVSAVNVSTKATVQSQPVQSQPVQSQPVQSQPVQSQPVQASVSDDNAYDPYVAAEAEKMKALLRMWDGSEVTYTGGRSFVIEGNFHVVRGSNIAASDSTYRTRVEVEVLPEGKSIRSDEELIHLVKNSSLYRQSLANRLGLKGGIAELDAMPLEKQVALALANRPVGVSEGKQTFKPIHPKVELFTGRWTREQVANDPNRVYLFGDNTKDRTETGYVPSSTQAVIRGLDNAIGIDTKKHRGKSENNPNGSPYFSDADFRQFKRQVDEAIAAAKSTGKTIVVPADGIGTGEAHLKEKAPRCFEYLQKQLSDLVTAGQNDYEFTITPEMVGVLCGKITLARQTKHPNVIYHEYFHSVMKFVKASGILSQEDIDNLRSLYGDSASQGTKWFNEEKAAEDFRKMVQDNVGDKTGGILKRLFDFITCIFRDLFCSGRYDSSRYGYDDIRFNPLTSIVLTGRVVESVKSQPTHRFDFRTKVAKAVATYVDQMDGQRWESPLPLETIEEIRGSAWDVMYDKQRSGSGTSGTTGFDQFRDKFNRTWLAPGFSITSVSNEQLSTFDQVDVRMSREGMMLTYFNPQWAASTELDLETLLAFGRYLDRLEEISMASVDTARTRGEGTAARERLRAVEALDKESGTDMFRQIYTKFMQEFAPVDVAEQSAPVQSAVNPPVHDVTMTEVDNMEVGSDGWVAQQEQKQVAASIAESPTIPNQNHESDLMSLFSTLPAVQMEGEYDDDGIRLAEEQSDEFGWEEPVDVEDPFAFSFGSAPDVAVRQAVSTVVPDRMARPYTRQYLLAAEVARAIRAGFSADALSPSTVDNLSRAQADSHSAGVHAAIEDAILRLGRLYGVDTSDDTQVRKSVYRTMFVLNSGIVSDERNAGREAGGTIRHAADDKGETSPASYADYAKGIDLSALVATASGVRPCDVIEALLSDIDAIVERGGYDTESSFVINVVNPVRAAITRFASADPSNLFGGVSPDGSHDFFGGVISSIRGGLTGGVLTRDGTRTPFAVGDRGASNNRDSIANIEKYSDHVGNPDFQDLMFRTLDALYLIQASGKYYRQIGMEPGRVEDSVAIRGLAPESAPPLTQAEMMEGLRISPEQLIDPGFDAVQFYDQPWFSARDPEMFLMSAMRPSFGGVSIREHMMEETREFAGYHTREAAYASLDDRRLGLDVLAGEAYTAVEEDYDGSGFDFKTGRITRTARARKTEKYSGLERKKAVDPSTGHEIIATKRDQRLADFWAKAVKVWASGGTKVLTGVDQISFSASDSYDPSNYSYEKAIQRQKPGYAGGEYNEIDKAIIRLHRQLHDDAHGDSWDDIIGDNGLDLVNRFVTEACLAMKAAHAAMNQVDENGNPVLTEREFNDFVLRRLSVKGIVAARESYVPGLNRHAMSQGVITIPVADIDRLFHDSSTYKKLIAAGRPAEKLTMKGMAEPHMRLFREMKEFVAKHPYLSDGDGAFFHNASTTLPFVQGSGFFMYHANRREHDREAQVAESLNEFEKNVFKAMDVVDLTTPATAANDGILRVAREVFHLEASVEEIRASIAEGNYIDRDGFHITSGSTVKDLVDAIYNRLTGMLWKETGDPVMEKIGGSDRVRNVLKIMESKLSGEASVVSGGVGMTDENVYRMTGVLPANHRLGHAVMNAVDGITNAFMFRSSMINMLTTPDEDGRPTCYARPADDAAETSGISDSIWSVIARWWAETSGVPGVTFDVTLSGVKNAQRIYDAVHGNMGKGGVMKDGSGRTFGELLPKDIDPKSITGFIASTGTPEDESSLSRVGGGYALGYAKHLLQSSRATGTCAVRKFIGHALAWSKGMSVTFSYFFPIATRFESPTGAVGGLATMLGNASPEFARKYAAALRNLQGLGMGKGWITKDFIGFKDVERMLDSDDPFLAHLYQFAGCLGISLSDARTNPDDEGRGHLVDDLNAVVARAREAWGDKAAKHLYKVLDSILLRGGEKAFTYHLNATKLAVTAQLCQKLQSYADEKKIAFDPVRDLKKYSSYLNAEIGGIDPLQYAWAHPKARSVLNGTFFSWGWTRGAWEAGGGKVIEQVLFGGHDVSRDERGYLIGRCTRMLLEVMFGFPIVMQILCKAIGMGLDPDHEDREDEKWFTWENESKIGVTSYDITPLMRGIAKRFPSLAGFLSEHKVLRALPAIAAAALHKPWMLAAGLPMYTGTDAANQTTRGRHYYMHFGKQGWEFVRWFTDPKGNFFSKLSMPLQRLTEGVLGRSLTWMDHPLPWADKSDAERWLLFSRDSATFNLLRAFMPFSLSSLVDSGDAGALSMVAPITMGASASSITNRIEDTLRKFIADDRRGYADASPLRRNNRKTYADVISKKNVTVAMLVDEARRNGFSEKNAHKLVNNAVNRITTGLYNELMDSLPLGRSDEDYDTARVAKILRKANRLGRLRDDIMKSIQERLEKQNRWVRLSDATKSRIRNIISGTATSRNPYGEPGSLDLGSRIRYTY